MLNENVFLEVQLMTCFFNVAPIQKKKPDYVILHVGTIDAWNHQSAEITGKLLKFKN